MVSELNDAGTQIQAAQRIPAKRDVNKNIPWHIIIRISDPIDKDTVL